MHQRSSTVQGEGLTNECRHHLLLLLKQAHDKKALARLCVRWEYFERNITTFENTPTPLLEEPLKFIGPSAYFKTL